MQIMHFAHFAEYDLLGAICIIKYEICTVQFCQTPDLDLRLGVDFTFAWQ